MGQKINTSPLKPPFNEKVLLNTREQISKDENQALYLFISYDLIDSTKLKERSGWSLIIRKFYDLIYSEFSKVYKDIKVWKYLGDEILLFLEITNYNDLNNSPQISNTILNNVLNMLNDYEKEKEMKREEFSNIKNIPNEISIKCTLWCAGVTHSPYPDIETLLKKDTHLENVGIELPGSNPKQVLDFLGKNIDIGFRIAKYSLRNKVSICAYMAYLLLMLKTKSHNKKSTSDMRIIGYEKLKGVWDDQYFPIVLYYPDWGEIEDSFKYHEHITNPFISKILRKRIESIKKLESVFKEANKMNEIAILQDICKDFEKSQTKDSGLLEIIEEKE